MIVDKTILRRLIKRFGVSPISDADPKFHKVLQGGENFIKAPAGFEPAITGGNYEWDDSINGYRLGKNQKIFLLPNGVALWIFKDILVRAIPSQSIQKWVSASDAYPMGKANAFFIVYSKLTGQELGQNETAGDDVPDGETEPGNGGGLATADDETQPYFSKQDIQNMLKGEFPTDIQSLSMASSIPVSGGEEEPAFEVPISGKPTGAIPDRSKVGNKPEGQSEADNIIQTLYKQAKVNPKFKLSKQNPIRLDSDTIIDLYNRAKTLPPEDKEKLIAFLKSGAVKPLEEGHITKATLEALMEHIVNSIMQEVDNVKKKSRENKKPASNPVSNSSKPEHSQMDWEPGQEQGFGPQRIDYEKWVIAVANKIWKDPEDIGKGRPSWQIMKVVKHPSGDYYFLGKEKTVHLRRAIKRADNKWYYLDPNAKNHIAGRAWIELGKQHPSDEPSIEQEQSAAGAAGPTSGPMTVKDKNDPLEEMTTSSGGGGSSAGTTGYMVPGAFSNAGGSEAGVAGSEKLGYKLTPIGRQEMRRKADKLYESVKGTLKMLKEMASGLGPRFDRAQKQYDAQMPPESDDLECPNCGGESGFYTDKGNRAGAFWWNAECPDCGHQWGDDNFDVLNDR